MRVPVWYRPDGSTPSPGTHALVIGVSEYPHRPFHLPHLPGSAVSALRFANWLKNERGYRPPDAPIASIRLLLAPRPSEIPPEEMTGAAGADAETVTNALVEWIDESCTDTRNVTILYVAGHGFRESREGALVLMHDEGRMRKPFHAALDIEGVREGFPEPTAPRRQYYFVDACRTVSDRIPAGTHRPAKGDLAPSKAVGSRWPAAIYYAAAADSLAYQGEQGTVFMEALLTCFECDAVEPETGTGPWVVKASRLQEALIDRVREYAAYGGRDQVAESGGAAGPIVFTLADQPNVPVILDVSPEDGRAGARARVSHPRRKNQGIPESPIPISGRTLPAGLWTVAVNFDPPSTKYADDSYPIFVNVPRFNEPIELAER